MEMMSGPPNASSELWFCPPLTPCFLRIHWTTRLMIYGASFACLSCVPYVLKRRQNLKELLGQPKGTQYKGS